MSRIFNHEIAGFLGDSAALNLGFSRIKAFSNANTIKNIRSTMTTNKPLFNNVIKRTSFLMLAIFFIGLFSVLSHWQIKRGFYKDSLFNEFSQQESSFFETLPSDLTLLNDYQQFQLNQLDWADMTFLWDNQMSKSSQQQLAQAGYKHLALLKIDEHNAMLVSLDWLAIGESRQNIPIIPTLPKQISARLRPIFDSVLLGENIERLATNKASKNPLIYRIQTPNIQAISALTEFNILPWILETDQTWQPSTMTAEKHWGYALQWALMAMAIFVLSIIWWRKNR
jgi:surfeit locus 1 family protein